MKPTIQKIAIIIGIAIIILIISIQFFSIRKLKDRVQLANVELATLNDSVSVHKSKSGQLTFKIASVEIDKRNLKESLETLELTTKELRNQGIKYRNIISAQKAQIEAGGKGSTIIRDTMIITNTDTIKTAKFDWSNDFLSLNGSIENKNLDFNYKYKTGINIVTEQRPKGTIVNFSLADPNATILTGTSITVTRKKSILEKWYITLPVGVLGGFLLAK
jgi:chaperonin cofactor prefoldin